MTLSLDLFSAAAAREAEAALDCKVVVAAVEGGWSVQPGPVAAPLMFLSGAKAEREAHALARALARAGRPAEVAIYDRAGGLAGARRYPGDAAAPRGPRKDAPRRAPPELAVGEEDGGSRAPLCAHAA